MRIEIEKLSPEGEPLAQTYPAGEPALGEENARLLGETVVTARALRTGDEVKITGEISAQVEAECDLCLKAFTLPLDFKFDTSFISAESERGRTENVELRGSDLDSSIYEGEEIDVDDLVREQILLALPTRLRCREDCKGLCPTCRADLNAAPCDCETREVDPRWAALANLKKEGE